MNKITHSLAALLLIAGLAGCSEEETLSGMPGDTRTPITITVTDGGYAAADKSGADTRAVDNGYTTTFTAGDKIGLYVVKNGETIAGNIPLTLTANAESGTLEWKADNALYYVGGNVKYYAYYPYKETLLADPAPSGDAVIEPLRCFGPVIATWTLATDQSTYAKYTAQDLMVGGDVPSVVNGAYSLSFSMKHAMALVVIETPTTKYTLSDDADYTWTAAAPGTTFYGFTPYFMDGTYRYLVKPNQDEAADLMGSYTATGSDATTVTKEYAVSPKNIANANYALYRVDGAAVTQKTHTLQAGDFYMNDGSLVGKDAELSDAQKKACIGIIYSTDASRIGDAAKEALKQKGVTTPHGLVMALTNASDGCRWGEYDKDENDAGTGPFQSNTSTLEAQYNNVDGYGETHWILDNYKDNSTTLMGTYSAFYHASRYGTAEGGTSQYAAPANITTGWFIPSMGQWWDILSNLGGIDLSDYQTNENSSRNISGAAQTAVDNMNKYLGKIEGAAEFKTDTYFWSSSEDSSPRACYVGFLSNGGLILYADFKNYRFNKLRCVLAF